MSKELLVNILIHPLRFLTLVLYKLNIFQTPRIVNQKTFFGKRITIVLPEIVSSVLYLTGRYEKDVENIFIKYIKKGDVVVDIGAHFGYFSLLALSSTGSKGKVYAFEPTRSTYEILKKNCSRYTNIKIINKAVYSKKDRLELHDYGLRFSALNSFFEPRINKDIQAKKITVQTTSLDDYFSTLNQTPDFIKIDAESSEYNILKGMQKILKTKKPILCIEAGDMDIRGVKTTEQIIDYMLKKKYKVYKYTNNQREVYQWKKQKKRHVNLLFLPENK